MQVAALADLRPDRATACAALVGDAAVLTVDEFLHSPDMDVVLKTIPQAHAAIHLPHLQIFGSENVIDVPNPIFIHSRYSCKCIFRS